MRPPDKGGGREGGLRIGRSAYEKRILGESFVIFWNYLTLAGAAGPWDRRPQDAKAS